MSDTKIIFEYDLPGMPKKSFLDLIEVIFKKAMFKAERRSKKEYLTGPRPLRLGVGTGRLRNSVRQRTIKQASQIKGSLGTNVVYGPIHEFGGKTGRNLSVRMPARPFLRPALESVIPSLEKDIIKKIKKEWDE